MIDVSIVFQILNMIIDKNFRVKDVEGTNVITGHKCNEGHKCNNI